MQKNLIKNQKKQQRLNINSHNHISLALPLFSLAFGIFSVTPVNAAFYTEASAQSFAQDSPLGLDSFAKISSGVPASNNHQSFGGISVATGSPINADVITSQVDGFAAASAEARANLGLGNLRNFAFAGDHGLNTRALANSSWGDTVTFNNTTGGTFALPFSWNVNGVLTDVNGPFLGGERLSSQISLSLNPSSVNRFPGFKDDNPSTPNGMGAALWQVVAGTSNDFVDISFPLGTPNDENAWTVNQIGSTGVTMSATLLLQPGSTSIDIASALNLDCGYGSTCDFGHTATFRFGDLPSGLTWNSESGVFLSEVTPVPIPATFWLFGAALLPILKLAPKNRKY